MKSETPETRLKQWRRATGLTQTDVAKLAGVSQAYISQIESGMSEIGAAGGKLKSFLEGVKRRRNSHFPIA